MRLSRPVRWALRGIGILLFAAIVSRIDLASALAALRSADPVLLAAALLLFLPIYALKSWRWHVLLTTHGLRVSFPDSFRTYCAALFLGTMTPGNVGEAVKIAFLRARGASLTTATLLTATDRLYDVLWVGIFAAPSAFFLLRGSFTALLLTLAAAGALFVGVALWLRRQAKRENAATLRARMFFWKPHALTLANWATYYLQLLTVGAAFHLTVPLPAFLGIMTVAGVLNLLAIAPAGLGTRDAAVLYFFRPYGVPAALSVAFTSTVFLLTITASLLGAYFWFRSPLDPLDRHDHAA